MSLEILILNGNERLEGSPAWTAGFEGFRTKLWGDSHLGQLQVPLLKSISDDLWVDRSKYQELEKEICAVNDSIESRHDVWSSQWGLEFLPYIKQYLKNLSEALEFARTQGASSIWVG